MDYGKSLTFITEDERWKEKVAIGVGVILLSGVLTAILIGVIGYIIVLGYCVRLMQNVRDGSAQPLPEWNAWGEDLVRGLKLLVVMFVWSLPLIIFTVPMGIGGAMTDSGGAGEFIGSMILLCGSCLAFLYGLFVALVAPGYSIAFAQDERIGSGLALTRIWQWTQANLGQVIVAMLIIIAAGIVISLAASIVGVLLCGIGLIVTLPLAGLVTNLFQYHIIGQLANKFPMAATSASAVDYPIAPAAEPQGAEVMAVAPMAAPVVASMVAPVETELAATTEAVAEMVEEPAEEQKPTDASDDNPEDPSDKPDIAGHI